jgi:MarR family transcriptional regulator, lower aerobic nicotinate degradation pathway regulator
VTHARHRPGDLSPFAIGLVTRQAHSRATSALVEALRPLGLELRHFAVMISLAEHGAVVQRDLATMSGTDKATMVRVVDDLERAGYAVRRPVAGDRRLASVELTDQGRSAFDAAHQAAAPLRDQLFAHMSTREADQLLRLLDKFTYPEHAPKGD